MPRHRVVIVGGGFGGLACAESLKRADVDVTLVDKRNFHLFQPLLYQVATGGLSPANVCAPLRSILRGQANANVVLAEAKDFDLAGKRLLLADGELAFDTLVVAPGMRNSWFGKPEWEDAAPGLKTIEDATRMRRRILHAFEMAERAPDKAAVREWLTFAVVGGGPTGVELAGTLGEIARYTLRKDFRRIDPWHSRIVLIEAGPRVLPQFSEKLAKAAVDALRGLGVEVRANTRVEDVAPGRVTLRSGDGVETLVAKTVLWAAGVAASPLGETLARAAGAELDRAGRVKVAPDLSLPGHHDVFVVGDLAAAFDDKGEPLPGLAPVATQQGHHVAKTIVARLLGEAEPGRFVYHDPGTMATIGRTAAVAKLGGLELTGFPAWLAWLFVHLLKLVRFENRALVFLQWAWNYFTFSRSARLITG